MDIKFSYVEEKDCDLLLIRLLSSYEYVKDYFFNKIGYKNVEIKECIHSFANEYGESDVVIIGASEGRKVALHIEDKIDANAQPDQASRYKIRCEKSKENSEIDDYGIFIFAPKAYLDANEEAKLYPNKVSYEELKQLLINNNGLGFDIALLDKAIDKQKNKQVIEDVAKAKFWEDYYNYLELNRERYPVKYHKTKRVIGSDAIWPHYQTKVKGVYIIFKSKNGCVDIQFEHMGDRLPEMIRKFPQLKADRLVKTAKSAAYRFYVTPIDFTKPFYSQLNEIEEALNAVMEAYKLIDKLISSGLNGSPID